MMTTVWENVRQWMERPDCIQLTGGGAVASLENKLVKHYGKRYALCVSNATMGLWATLKAVGLEQKEIICPSLTWGGSVSGALLLNNRIHLADIESGSLCLSPEAIDLLARSSKARAVIAVDFGGNPHDMMAMREVCNRHDLFYLADAAQSLGASIDGKPASFLADAVVVSLGSRKTIAAGEGAAILTDDRILYEKLVLLTQHPLRQQKDIGFEVFNEFAINGRIHPLAAIIADGLFEESISETVKKSETVDQVLRLLDTGGLIYYPLQKGAKSVWYHKTATRRPNIKPETIDCFLKREMPDWVCSNCCLQPLYRLPFFKTYRHQFQTILSKYTDSVLQDTVQF